MALPITLEWIQKTFGSARWDRAITPNVFNSPDWRARAQEAGGTVAQRAFRDVEFVAESTGADLNLLISNIYALASEQSSKSLAGIGLALSARPELSLAREISDSLTRSIDSADWTSIFTCRDLPDPIRRVPDFSAENNLALQLRLIRDKGKADAGDIFGILADFPDVRRGSMAFLCDSALQDLEINRRLTTSEFDQLPTRLRWLVVNHPELDVALIDGSAVERSARTATTQRRWQTARKFRKVAHRFLHQISQRDLTGAEKTARKILAKKPSQDELDLLDATAEVSLDLMSKVKDAGSAWPPIRPAAAKLLQLMLRRAETLSAVDTLSTKRGKLYSRLVQAHDLRELVRMHETERHRLQTGWTQRQKEGFVRAGMLDAIQVIDSALVRTFAKLFSGQLNNPRIREAFVATLDERNVADALVSASRNGDRAALALVGVEAFRREHILYRLLTLKSSLLETHYLASRENGKNWLEYEDLPAALLKWSALKPRGPFVRRWLERVVKHLSAPVIKNRYSGYSPPARANAPDTREVPRDLTKHPDPDLVRFLTQSLPSAAPYLLVDGSVELIAAVLQSSDVGSREIFWCTLSKLLPSLSKDRIAGIGTAIRPQLDRLTATELMSVCRYFPNLRTAAVDEAGKLRPNETTRTLIALGTAYGVQPSSVIGDAAISEAASILSNSPARAGALALGQAIGLNWMPRLATTAVASVRNPTVRGAKLDAHYRSYLLPKQSGGTRTILVPEPWLKGLQRRIYEKLLRPLGAHDCAHGFVPGRSILTNATPHVGKSVVVTCDIAKAFPSITWSLVLHALKRDLGERLPGPAISLLVDICCHAGGLPIGAPTSPALLNRVLLPADRIFSAEADKHGLSYTRYADDLTFSGGNDAPGMLRIVRRILGEIGLHLDDRKTNIFRCGRRQMVTGLSVNQRANVPRRLRRRLRAAVHRQVHGDEPQWQGKPLSLASLKGHLHFLEMIDPDSARALLQQLQEPSA